jgi:predicted DNA binding protein
MFNHEVILPSSKTKIKFRPWSIADELDLSENDNQIDFIKKIVACPEIIDNIESAELYFLLKEIRSVSKMSRVEFTWKCYAENCSLRQLEQDGFFELDDDVLFQEKKTDNVYIDEKLKYYFKNLTFAETIEFNKSIDLTKVNVKKITFNKIVTCVKTIIFNDEIMEDLTFQQKYDFISNRPKGELDILFKEFKNSQNVITLSKTCKCLACHAEKEISAGLDFLQL